MTISRSKKPLTHNEKLLCDFYAGNPDTTQLAAYKKYHPKAADKSCRSNATRFFARATVKAYIAERELQIQNTFQLEQEWVVKELVDNVKRCKQAQPVLDNTGTPTGEYRYDASGANKALELLGRHLKMFTDRVEVSDPLKERLAQMSDEELLAQMESLLVSEQLYAHLSALGLTVKKAETQH